MKTIAAKLLRRSGQLLLVLCLAGLLGTGWYGYKRGFTHRWRESVFEEFRRHGVEVTFRQLTLDPFRGLVARYVTLYDTTDRHRVLAEIDHAVLSVDLSRLARGRPFLTALELRDTRLSLPLEANHSSGKRLEVNNLRARLFFPNKQIHIAQADARVLGCRIRAQGWIANPGAFQPATTEGAPGWAHGLKQAIEHLQTVAIKGEGPLVHLQFSGDILAPNSLLGTLKVAADDIAIRGYPIDSMEISATWRDGTLELRDLSLEDNQGRLRAVGRWKPQEDLFDFQIESTLDPALLARAFGMDTFLAGFEFRRRPAIQAQIRNEEGAPAGYRFTGNIRAQNFSRNGEPFESLESSGSWEKERWSVRELQIRHGSGFLKGDFLASPGRFHGKISSNLSVDLLATVLPARLAASFRWLQSKQPARLELELDGSSPDFKFCSGWGYFHLGQSTIQGVPIEDVETPLTLEAGQVLLGPFKVQHTEGGAEGSLTYDLFEKNWFLHDIQLQMYPTDVLKMIRPQWVSELAPYQFTGTPPKLKLEGKISSADTLHTRLAVTIESSKGMNYEVAGKKLPFSSLGGSLLFEGHQLHLAPLEADFLGGKTVLTAQIPLVAAGTHKASLQLSGVDFASLSKLYTGYSDSKGSLDAAFEWTGNGANLRKINGTGQLSIHEGNLFEIPFLGPLSTLLNAIVPGLGSDTAHRATATFNVEQGVASTRDLQLDGSGFSVHAQGEVHFPDDKIHLATRLNARGLPGVLLFPVSKLFEYVVEGPLRSPQWRPRILPDSQPSPDPAPKN